MDTLDPRRIGELSRAKAEREIRARVQTVPVGDDLVLARVLGHPKMLLHGRDLGFSMHVMLDGYWEIWLTMALTRLIKPGMVVVDVGANFGYYTILANHCAWPGGRVIAIEPNPAVVPILRKTVTLNGFASSTRIEQAAAGAEDGGPLTLFVPDDEPKNATIVARGFRRAGGVSVDVPVRSIDSLCRDLDRVDIVKVDAEGAEIEVVEGMRETIARHAPTLVLEFNTARYKDPGKFLERLTRDCGTPRLIDFNGDAVDTSVSEILDSAVDQDKLLLFPGRGA